MSDAIAALAKRFWRIHPNEIPLGITREQYYEREMRALFTTQATRIEAMEVALQQSVDDWRERGRRIEQLEARLDRAVTRGLEQVEQIATLEAALRDILGAHDLYETECIASTALAPEQDK